jgi:hypothetical protein
MTTEALQLARPFEAAPTVPPWMARIIRETCPAAVAPDPVAWMERHVRLVGSSRSDRFDSSLTPWVRDPIRAAATGRTRRVTFVKPVQSGGSAAGECVVCYWLATSSGGDVHYNWTDNDKALSRWDKRIEKILLACAPVMARAPALEKHAGKWKRGMVVFPHCNLTVQGVHQPSNLDSDTIRFEVNEELHDWEDGRLLKAYNRTTACWNAAIFNISNAGPKNGQLHMAFKAGTMRQWEVLCPGCRQFHYMRAEWDDKKPELGGLRYDSDGCRLKSGEYDYNRLAPTVRFQMPCGHEVRDDFQLRRALSDSGRYSAPQNPGADPLLDESFILEAVAVHDIPWLQLIQDKHAALRDLKNGAPETWWKYLMERESRFVDVGADRPRFGEVIVNSALRKNRAGMPNRAARFAALDKQRGKKDRGEMPHWWMVIRDVDAEGNSLLVYEGKVLTDADAARTLAEHQVEPGCVVCDSGDGATSVSVYNFCLEYGYNAIKGSPQAFFSHGEDGRKIFSPEQLLHQMLNMPRTREDPSEEPFFWHYSKSGIRERLLWWRHTKRWDVPGDVSEDYKEHLEAESYEEKRNKQTGELEGQWVQLRDRNDLLVCEAYIGMLAEMAGLIGAGTIIRDLPRHPGSRPKK